MTAHSGHLQECLDLGDVDLSPLYKLDSSPCLAVTPLVEEELWAVAPPGSDLAPEPPVECRFVLEHPLVLPVSGHGLRALIEQARSTIEMQPRIAVEVNSLQLQKTLVQAGHGWSMLPAGVSHDVESGLLAGAPFAPPRHASGRPGLATQWAHPSARGSRRRRGSARGTWAGRGRSVDWGTPQRRAGQANRPNRGQRCTPGPNESFGRQVAVPRP